MKDITKLESGLYNVYDIVMRIPIVNKLLKTNGWLFKLLSTLYRKNPLYLYLFLNHVFISHFKYDKNTILGTLNTGAKLLVRKKYIYDEIHIVNETLVQRSYGGGALSSTLKNIKDKIVIDIGANIGDTAVFYGMMGARVYAYEPDINCFELAKRNIAINNLSENVQIYNMGVGHKDGKFKLIIHKRFFPGWSRVDFSDSEDGNEINVISFTKVLSNFKTVHLVKLDCEGCEFNIIESALCSDITKVENYVMEFHGDPQKIIDKFKECGYHVICGVNDPSAGLPKEFIFASKNG